MDLGIFETVFPRASLDASFAAVASHGLRHVQFDFGSVGLSSLPDQVADAVIDLIAEASTATGVRIDAVSGTYNMAHPDPHVRNEGLAALRAIAATSQAIEAPVITLCTGTRDPDNMWRRHPANATTEAWETMLASIRAALEMVAEHDLLLAFEPEPANIVANAARGRELLQTVADPRLKVILDPANIVASDRERSPAAVLDEAFALLGEHIVLAHAKDLSPEGAFCAAGRGIVPWDHCLDLFAAVGYDGPIILHSLAEEDADRAVGFLRERIAEATKR